MLKLTIAIPVYNAEDYIERAIKSCENINLSLDEYEILVVDNNSTDNTIQVVKDIKSIKFKNIKIHKNNTNIGRVNNWNKCLELAEGEYLIFLFSSDELNKNINIKEDLKKLDENTFISLYKQEVIFNNNYGKYDDVVKKVKLNNFIENNFIKNYNYCCFGILQQNIYRMDIIKKNNIRFDEAIPRTTDRVFIFEVINCGNKEFLYKNQPIAIWNMTNNRFHNNAHNKISDKELRKDMDILWGNEVEANKKILLESGYSQREIDINFYKHYSHIKIEKIIKYILRKPIEKELLTVKYYREYINEIKKLEKVYIYIGVFKKLLKRLFCKVLKLMR